MRVVHASETVEMDDPIEIALRRKKDSLNAGCYHQGERR